MGLEGTRQDGADRAHTQRRRDGGAAEAGVGFERTDPNRDRLYSVGNFVNRGPHTIEAIDWLTDGRIAGALAGNHEIWTLGSLVNGRYHLGRDWRAEIREQHLVRWMVTLEELPLAI